MRPLSPSVLAVAVRQLLRAGAYASDSGESLHCFLAGVNKSHVIATSDSSFIYASNLLPSLPTPLPYTFIERILFVVFLVYFVCFSRKVDQPFVSLNALDVWAVCHGRTLTVVSQPCRPVWAAATSWTLVTAFFLIQHHHSDHHATTMPYNNYTLS